LRSLSDGAGKEAFEESRCRDGPDVMSFTGGVRGRIGIGSRLHGRILCEEKKGDTGGCGRAPGVEGFGKGAE
jgi:hypothetical protein